MCKIEQGADRAHQEERKKDAWGLKSLCSSMTATLFCPFFRVVSPLHSSRHMLQIAQDSLSFPSHPALSTPPTTKSNENQRQNPNQSRRRPRPPTRRRRRLRRRRARGGGFGRRPHAAAPGPRPGRGKGGNGARGVQELAAAVERARQGGAHAREGAVDGGGEGGLGGGDGVGEGEELLELGERVEDLFFCWCCWGVGGLCGTVGISSERKPRIHRDDPHPKHPHPNTQPNAPAGGRA